MIELGKSGWFQALLEDAVARHARAPAPEAPPLSRPAARARAYLHRALRESGLVYGTPELPEDTDRERAPEQTLFLAVLRTLAGFALDAAVLFDAPPGPRSLQLARLFALWTGEVKLADAFHAHPFSRFTPRAKGVVVAAEEEARELRHDHIFPEHLALGLLHEPEALAARAISALGVTPEAAREALVAVLSPATVEEPVSGKIPFTPRAKKVLELALREALLFGHNYIGTEHLLLGLLDDEESPDGGTLTGLGITRVRAREWLIPELERLAEAKRRAG